MVIFVLRDLYRLHDRQERLVKLAETESQASKIECRVVNLHCPADKFKYASVRVRLGHLRPHLIIEISVEIVDSFLVIFSVSMD